MKLARFTITDELLKSALHLPEDCHIVDIGKPRYLNGGMSVELAVHCEAFEDVKDGDPIPVRTPWYRSNGGKAEFDSWV